MAVGTSPLTRCGIDTVEIACVERLLLAMEKMRGGSVAELVRLADRVGMIVAKS